MSVTRVPVRIVVAILAVLLIAVLALFAWPLDSDGLHPPAQRLSADAARAAIAERAAREEAEPGLRAECRSRALLHDAPVAKSVLMLHGFTDCPAQFAELAQVYFERGYNVYVPLAPRHGFPDRTAIAGMQARELAEYASGALDVAVALGDETGVIGMSGGGVLATWLTTNRVDDVRHLLAISPFYRPAPSQAPPIVIKPFTVLFGFRLVPDVVNGNDFSFAALAQYLRLGLTMDTGRDDGNLATIAVVTSPNDDFIDLGRAVSIPRDIAEGRGLRLTAREIPADTGIGHDAVDPAGLGDAKDALYEQYVSLYEG
ncbi:carboxylesterase [Catenuloplanes nepalensis]|uniref:Carboxylesterase n=1 Tax=Catenuloplanes nepalensis TaxID=587533 RepID=A0ABT9MMH7_9ACTN|nr:hypothetical protein [Catenuloplanes nepalensis]MDP9792246.1 carboxylesterase [Catenuloplanes nepalensis]